MLPANEAEELALQTDIATSRWHEWLVVAVALLVGLLLFASSLFGFDGDLTAMLKFGSDDPAAALTAHVEAVLDRSVATTGKQGHDGRFFFLQALDPLYLSPDEHAVYLDRPRYRAQRMLYPLVAGVGGLVSPEAVLWSMAFINVAALALGTLGTARLAQRLGGSAWLGLAFTLNPGIIFEFDISGAGIVAFACAVWGTLAIIDARTRSAIVWFVAAVLAREVMLLYLAGVCCHRLFVTRRIPWALGAIPALSVFAWMGYVRLRLNSTREVTEIQEFGPPFGGMLDAFDNWLNDPIDLAIIVGLIAMMPLLVLRAVQRPNPLAWGALGFVPLAILMTSQVWFDFFDISRAITPIMTAYVLTAFTAPRRRRDDAASPS
jgi:hypothetical protein